jgi:hypothetical protein
MSSNSQNKIGLRVIEQKILKLLTALKSEFNYEKSDLQEEYSDASNEQIEKAIRINRLKLRRLISGTLNLVDRHTITGYINLLISNNFISPNPTSERIQLKSKNPHSFYYQPRYKNMPNNDSLYIYNIKNINQEIKKLKPPHTPSQSLLHFVSSSPENQKENMDNSAKFENKNSQNNS